MSDPILTHRLRCRICEREIIDRLDDAACELCGIRFHFTCWLAHAATATERRPFQDASLTDYERQDLTEAIVMHCVGCRS